jgi:hypothetical protein
MANSKARVTCLCCGASLSFDRTRCPYCKTTLTKEKPRPKLCGFLKFLYVVQVFSIFSSICSLLSSLTQYARAIANGAWTAENLLTLETLHSFLQQIFAVLCLCLTVKIVRDIKSRNIKYLEFYTHKAYIICFQYLMAIGYYYIAHPTNVTLQVVVTMIDLAVKACFIAYLKRTTRYDAYFSIARPVPVKPKRKRRRWLYLFKTTILC